MIRRARRKDPFNNILTCHSYHQMMSAYVPLCHGCSRMHVALVHQWLSRTLQNAPSSSVSFRRSSEPLDLCAYDQIRSSIGMFSGEPKKSFPWKGHLLMMACKESFYVTVPLEWVSLQTLQFKHIVYEQNRKKLLGTTDLQPWGKKKKKQSGTVKRKREGVWSGKWKGWMFGWKWKYLICVYSCMNTTRWSLSAVWLLICTKMYGIQRVKYAFNYPLFTWEVLHGFNKHAHERLARPVQPLKSGSKFPFCLQAAHTGGGRAKGFLTGSVKGQMLSIGLSRQWITVCY